MIRCISILAVSAILFVLPILAADFGKFTNWADSPQGWFMTSAERAQWSTLTSEAEAEKFVADFLAKRDSKFASEIAKRVEMADKYFTVGETRGSHALRGKVVILLGPPSSMDISAKKTASRAGGRTGSVDMAMGAGGDTTGVGLADLAEVDQREGMKGSKSASVDKLYTITYGAEQLPTRKGMSVVIEVDGTSGKDKMRDKRAFADLGKVFDAVAEASIKQ